MGVAHVLRRRQGSEGSSVASPSDQLVLRMEPPLECEYQPIGPHEYIISSAVTVLGEPETYLFACDEHGEVEHWIELDGSQKGTLDHARVLGELGYEIVGGDQ